MTADEGPWEIPPIDDAPDIARDSAPPPGATMADARNWPGYGLLLVAAAGAIAAAVLAGFGLGRLSVVAAIITVVFLLVGVGLIVLEQVRARRRTEQPAERATVPPGLLRTLNPGAENPTR
ncbi:hypothetical protein IU498_33900 [Nocardia beijingensis]|uniref:hypothetical protein n=1 Tax=Nocardia beijingensis TaxID=95162 RepID=UPI0018962242|nr:hypothetical protein [Nocardia beijingensis]MBF6079617.1 hypothetical protein [Nocardia beijingensis]